MMYLRWDYSSQLRLYIWVKIELYIKLRWDIFSCHWDNNLNCDLNCLFKLNCLFNLWWHTWGVIEITYLNWDCFKLGLGLFLYFVCDDILYLCCCWNDMFELKEQVWVEFIYELRLRLHGNWVVMTSLNLDCNYLNNSDQMFELRLRWPDSVISHHSFIWTGHFILVLVMMDPHLISETLCIHQYRIHQ